MIAPPSATVERVAKMICGHAAVDECNDAESYFAAATHHSGDCTKECHTCILCRVTMFRELARDILAALPRAAEVQRLAEAWVAAVINYEGSLTAANCPAWQKKAYRVEREECETAFRQALAAPPVDPVKQIYDEADAAMTAYGEWCEQEDVAASPSTRDPFLAGYAAKP